MEDVSESILPLKYLSLFSTGLKNSSSQRLAPQEIPVGFPKLFITFIVS